MMTVMTLISLTLNDDREGRSPPNRRRVLAAFT